MKRARLLAVLLGVWGALAPTTFGQQQQAAVNASVSGAVKTIAGIPASAMRVAVMDATENTADPAGLQRLLSVTETDAAGRYRLENIPPGKYYVIAGVVTVPTYYPGTLDMTKAAAIVLTAGATAAGIDFVIQDVSLTARSGIRPVGVTFLVTVRVEGGGKAPVSSPAGYTTLQLIRTNSALGLRTEQTSIEVLLSAPEITLAPFAEFRVNVGNLPEGYAVESITNGSTDLMTETLKIAAPDFQATDSVERALTTNVVTLDGPPTVLASHAKSGLIVTLTAPESVPPAPGVRVTGRAPAAANRQCAYVQRGCLSVYLSGAPGILYADGSFEFRGVRPGRYLLLVVDDSKARLGLEPPFARGATVLVGDRDIDGIELQPISILPEEIFSPAPSPNAGPLSPRVISPVALSGRVVEDGTNMPAAHADATLSGFSRETYLCDQNGEFTIRGLLPGHYRLRIAANDHLTINLGIDIGDEDIHLNLRLP
jgi:hypothetical protein